MVKKSNEKYRDIFWEFCGSFIESDLKEEWGVAGDKVSPYHIMTCNLKKPQRMQIEFSQGGEQKSIHLTNFEKKKSEMYTIKDDALNSVVLEGEPTDRTFITRDLDSPQLHQGHQMVGDFDKVELRFFGGMYGRMYWIEARGKQ